MKVYNIATLKSKLSGVLNEVVRGEEVLVTDHNRPVARIIGLKSYGPLPSFDLKGFLSAPLAKLKPGVINSTELIRKIRDGDE